MKCTSSVRGSTRPSTSAPFTFMVTWVFAIFNPFLRPARPAARVSARVTMMPPTCLRYSTGPRASAAGDMIATAAAAAFFSVAASRLVPITALAASAASSGVSCRLVRPIAQLATLPPAMVSTTAAAAVA